jgi:hypothetical protein
MFDFGICNKNIDVKGEILISNLVLFGSMNSEIEILLVDRRKTKRKNNSSHNYSG